MTRLLVSFCLLGAAIYAADILVPPPRATVASIEPAPTRARQLRSWGTTLSNLPLGHKPQLASNPKPAPLPPQQSAAVEDQLATATDGAEQGSVEWTKVATAAKVHSKASVSSPTVKYYPSGTELQVVGRDGGWVGVSDPVTKERGWVFEKYLAAIGGPSPTKTQTAMRSAAESDPSQLVASKPPLTNLKKRTPARPLLVSQAMPVSDAVGTTPDAQGARASRRADGPRRRFFMFAPFARF